MTSKYTQEIIKSCKTANKIGGRKMERACLVGAISSLMNAPICPDKKVDKTMNKVLAELEDYKFKRGGVGGDLH